MREREFCKGGVKSLRKRGEARVAVAARAFIYFPFFLSEATTTARSDEWFYIRVAFGARVALLLLLRGDTKEAV